MNDSQYPQTVQHLIKEYRCGIRCLIILGVVLFVCVSMFTALMYNIESHNLEEDVKQMCKYTVPQNRRTKLDACSIVYQEYTHRTSCQINLHDGDNIKCYVFINEQTNITEIYLTEFHAKCRSYSYRSFGEIIILFIVMTGSVSLIAVMIDLLHHCNKWINTNLQSHTDSNKMLV
ncbi:MAG: hypothetical protein Homavirus30_5 [Homavirus sp.]|uniref:Uncharacterized protein n=1 Tax=Homavirus sp. TaxID=2487769 RepID=A0A3G5A926_9VIRU|nr:MAG: hypothetical protein Homavirus30_5 [Homavirus sp.]